MKTMKEKLLSWFSTSQHEDTPAAQESIDVLCSVTAHMLIHLARIDGNTQKEELTVVQDILIKAFNQTPEQVDTAIQKAIDEAEQHDDWYRYLRQVAHAIEKEERIELLRHLWMVVLADGRIDSYEANFMRRIGALLGISDKEMNAIRVRLIKENL